MRRIERVLWPRAAERVTCDAAAMGVILLKSEDVGYGYVRLEYDVPEEEVYSGTGEIHGQGSDPYKWVSYLMPKHRRMVRLGYRVYVEGGSTHGGNPSKRYVHWNARRGYFHRVNPQF